MHNNIMAAGSRDRPPMLATGRYAQWRSRFLRYIDTRPNGDALRKCILKGPYTPTIVTTPAVPATEDSLAVPEQTTVETEVNELRAERMAKNANPLALVATAQTLQDLYYQTSKPHKSYAPTSKASLPTRSHATTRYKGKGIAKPITPPSELASEEYSDPEQAHKDKDMQKILALIEKYFKKLYKPTNNNLRTSSNTRNKNVDTTPRYKNDNQTGQFGNQRAVNLVGARETVGGLVVQQYGDTDVLTQGNLGHYARNAKAKLVTETPHTDEEIDKQELEAHYSYMTKIQEVPNADSGTDAEPLEHWKRVIVMSLLTYQICVIMIFWITKRVECDDERVALANLIANLKLDVDENKKIQKQLKKANATLTQELTECKSILAETSRTLGESNSIQDSCLVALQNKQTEFERFKAFNDRTVDYDKLERRLNETLGLLAQKEIDIKESLKVKAYEISVVKEKHDELVKQSLLTKSHYEGLVKEKTKVITDLKLKEEKDIDKMISMENQISIMYDSFARNVLSKDVMCSYLQSSSDLDEITELQCLYLHKVRECDCLAQRLSEQTGFEREQYFEIQDLKAQLQDKNIAIRVAHKTNVSRPQPRSNQMKDKVVPNTSHVKFKKTEVEEHPRISSISNQTKSVTACNDIFKFPELLKGTRKPKSQANKSVATSHKKTVASESTITNSRSYYKMLYKKTSKAWKWWIAQQCPSSYTWVPKTKRKWVPKVRNASLTEKIVQLILFIVDSGCTKHMTGNLSLLCNFVEKYLGTVRFGNDQFAPILGYGDLVQGNITIKRVYYIEGLNHNLFSVGQFCDADLEVAFRNQRVL
ncbi:hypothetical protein Tco_0624392 [Tanacetum coccineum]|uniref:Retrovirus-related Pol polyprotein from transposon TNT 1-94-like beta-barrel domain-containing protein n=1 Tax=Tanacetum coccineum TaxID=301880 RepID=A0ABQ4WDR5_9ASTR